MRTQYNAGRVLPPTNPVVAACLDAASKRAGVELALLHSLAYHVSGYNPAASMHTGMHLRLGLFGLEPELARRLNVDPFNPARSSDAVAQYLKNGHAACRGSWAHALAAFFWDQGAGAELVRTHMEPASWPPFVQRAVERVLTGAGISMSLELPAIIVGRA